MKMQHFNTESTVFERGGTLLYISIKKSFSTFLTFFLILAYIDCEETKGDNPQNPNFSGSPKN